ncbi:MAG TPA: hypothetical protein DCM86_20455 [Verrucomicrobiales bacterium]|nr:hypothetical protein [Verrucomicrobiales bacterium]
MALGLSLLSPSAAPAADGKASDAAGTWTWTVPGRNGGPERKSTLKLAVDGEKLTGKVTSPGRGGNGTPTETAIEDGKIKDGEVSFKVNREFNGNKFIAAYKGKLEGDSIKGKIEIERDGEKQSRDWEAKREVEKKP